MSWFNRTRKERTAGGDPCAAPTPIDAAGRETRPALGFSLLELEQAGLSERQAKEMGLRVDLSRCSAVGSNIIQLKRFLSAK